MFTTLFQNNNTQDTYENIERDLLEKQSIIDQKNEIIKHQEKKIEGLEKGPEEHHILGKLIHERPDGVQMYASTCRKLFPNTRSWEFNRPLDKEHVKALYGSYRSCSRHAGGVVVGEQLDKYMPLIASKSVRQTPWSEGQNVRQLEPLGFIKFVANGEGILFESIS